ncbi:leucine-rich repeat protein [Tanacetum coccineum]
MQPQQFHDSTIIQRIKPAFLIEEQRNGCLLNVKTQRLKEKEGKEDHAFFLKKVKLKGDSKILSSKDATLTIWEPICSALLGQLQIVEESHWRIRRALGALERLPLDDANRSYSDIIGKLTTLDLSSNHLNGSIPESFGSLTSLKYLDLSVNELTGPIPTSLGRLVSLQLFLVHSNSLNGTVPVFIEADYKFSKLTFIVSREWKPPFQLIIVDLSSSKIINGFPRWFRTQKKLKGLMLAWLSNASITGPLPTWSLTASGALQRRVMVLAPGQPILTETSLDSPADALSYYASSRSSSDHSLPAPSSGMRSSHHLCSLVLSVHRSSAIFERPSHDSFSVSRSRKRDLLPSPKRIRSPETATDLEDCSEDRFEPYVPREVRLGVDFEDESSEPSRSRGGDLVMDVDVVRSDEIEIHPEISGRD